MTEQTQHDPKTARMSVSVDPKTVGVLLPLMEQHGDKNISITAGRVLDTIADIDLPQVLALGEEAKLAGKTLPDFLEALSAPIPATSNP